jgi:glycosyltransferase involved in cell wall biosynthesis
MTSLVSVIIPCRDGGAWLGEAIRSCLDQTWRNLEIIVVDNGSTDASLAVAKAYESSGVKVTECRRPGASAARNVGLDAARGHFVQFLDADDVLDRDKIRLQMERLVGGAAEAVASCSWSRFRDRPGEAPSTPEPVWRDLLPEEFLISSWLGGGMMPNFAWLTPHAVIERAGRWNETLSLNDDGEFFSRVVLASSAILFCPEARGFYRSSDTPTLSRRRDADALASAFAAIDLSCGQLLERCRSAPAARACAAHYQRFAYTAYPQVPDLVKASEQRVARLGGSDLAIGGGREFQILSRWFGWKFAKRCQLAWQLRRAAASG